MRLRYRHMTYHYIDGTQNQLHYHYHQLIQEALHQSHQALLQRSKTWRPLADISESAVMMTVKVELAGMQEEDIDVTLYEDALVISGDRHEDHVSQEGLYYHEAQIRYGPFRADAYLSTPVQTDLASAVYQNGMLRISLPRRSQEGVSTDEPEQGTESQRGGVGSDNPDAGEHAGSSPFGHAMTTQPTSGRLTYTSLKEISHA